MTLTRTIIEVTFAIFFSTQPISTAFLGAQDIRSNKYVLIVVDDMRTEVAIFYRYSEYVLITS